MSARSIHRAHARESARRERRRTRRAAVSTALAIGGGALFASSADAAGFQVNSNGDGPASACDATCTLRDAVAAANANADLDTITFAPTVTGQITLTAGEIPIDAAIDIQGPGQSDLTVSGDANGDGLPDAGDSRVFLADVTTMGSEGDPITISGLTLADGFAADKGGTMQSYFADLTIRDVTFRSGVSGGSGGGLYSAGRLTVDSSTFVDNEANDGGGLYTDQEETSTANGDVTITNSAFTGNEATDYNGGGAYFDQYNDTITIAGSTFSGNEADDDGAGLNVFGARDGGFTMRNSTVSGNTAGGEGGGVKFGNYFDVPARIENSTIANNTATTIGGGVYRVADDDVPPGTDDTVALSSTIVADNTAPIGADLGQRVLGPGDDPIVGTFRLGFSLVEAPTTGVATSEDPAGSNLFGVDPALGVLADNGGPTQTRLPAPSSAVVDAGTGNGLGTDQRGFPRTTDIPGVGGAPSDGTDIGAVELRVAAAKINGGPKGATKKNRPKFRFSGPDATSFECRIDGGTFSPCTSPFQPAKKLKDGKHKFEVRAISADGAPGPAAKRKFTVDTEFEGAKLRGKKAQGQRGGKVKVKVKASAKEAADVVAKGSVVVGGRSYPLKKATKSIKPGKARGIALKAKGSRASGEILDAIARGKKVVAKVKAKFTDDAGNGARVKRNVRLK